MELQKDINVCKPSEQGYCPAVLFPVFGSGGNSHPAPEKLNQY